MSALKFTIVGPAGVGKTTLKRIFFEQIDPLKLLEESLEPTYGAETSTYDLGKEICVFDLAGQQLDEWLSISKEIFNETDLLILILDSSNCLENWNRNIQLVNAIKKIKEEYCPNSVFGIFFHKIDLLFNEKKNELKKKIRDLTNESKLIYAFLTSIDGIYFPETFINFSFLVRKAIRNSKSHKISSNFLKSAILNQFLLKKELPTDDIVSYLDIPLEEANKFIENLIQEQIIEKNDQKNIITLTRKGRNLLKDIERKLYSKFDIKKILKKIPLKAIIISDQHGRSFLNYEIQKNYFDILVASENMDSDPQLISMFFAALSDFGKTIDEEGFNEIYLFAKNVKIIIITYKEISAIFFFGDIKYDYSITKILKSFLKNFYLKFEKEIKEFLRIYGILNYEDLLVKSEDIIEDLNILLKTQFDIGDQSTERRLLNIYLGLEEMKLNEETQLKIKQLITKYSFTKDEKILKQVEDLLKLN